MSVVNGSAPATAGSTGRPVVSFATSLLPGIALLLTIGSRVLPAPRPETG